MFPSFVVIWSKDFLGARLAAPRGHAAGEGRLPHAPCTPRVPRAEDTDGAGCHQQVRPRPKGLGRAAAVLTAPRGAPESCTAPSALLTSGPDVF